MIMNKVLIFLAVFLIANIFLNNTVMAESSGDKVSLTVTVKNVTVNGGDVYIAIYSSKDSYKQEVPDYGFIEASETPELSVTVNLSPGEYAFAVFQDINNNGTLDTGIFGIPKEPVALSNWSGKGLPGGWEKQKMTIGHDTGRNIVLSLSSR